MSEADEIWRSKTDEELSEAGYHLAEYTEEGQRIIRAELKRRGLFEPAIVCSVDEHANAVTRRYRDAYRVVSVLARVGTTMKVIGGIVAILIVGAVLQPGSGPWGSVGAVLGGLVMAVCISAGRRGSMKPFLASTWPARIPVG